MVLDSNQYGAVPESSTTIALLSMIYEFPVMTFILHHLCKLCFELCDRCVLLITPKVFG